MKQEEDLLLLPLLVFEATQQSCKRPSPPTNKAKIPCMYVLYRWFCAASKVQT